MQNNLLIRAVGDIAPGDFIINGIGVFSVTKKFGCDFPLEKIKNQLSGSDLLIGNLEDVLSKQCIRENLRHCGDPGIAGSLKKVGFNALSMANNHSFDHGKKFFFETVRYCRDAGIEVCGLRGKGGYYCKPVIIEKKGYRIGILAYNWIGLERDDSKEFSKYIAVVEDGIVNYSLNRNTDRDKKRRNNVQERNKYVHSDIKKLRGVVDVLVLLPHWGYEWTIYPPFGLTVEARSFIDSGVDIILGSHSHVPQGIETYNNGLIAYSLGNFLFDGYSKINKTGMMIEIETSKTKIINYNLSFVRRNQYFQPIPVSISEEKINIDLIDKSSRSIGSEDCETILDDEKIFNYFVKQYKKLKYHKILFLLGCLPRHPLLFKPFIKKVFIFFHVLILNVKGKRVRW